MPQHLVSWPNLDGRGVADEGARHGQALGRDVAHGRLHVVGDPVDKVAGIFESFFLSFNQCYLIDA